jgi:hypothetical protein
MLIIVFAIAAGIAYRLDTQGILQPAPAGLLEHLSLLAGFGWRIASGIYLHRNGTVLPRRHPRERHSKDSRSRTASP